MQFSQKGLRLKKLLRRFFTSEGKEKQCIEILENMLQIVSRFEPITEEQWREGVLSSIETIQEHNLSYDPYILEDLQAQYLEIWEAVVEEYTKLNFEGLWYVDKRDKNIPVWYTNNGRYRHVYRFGSKETRQTIDDINNRIREYREMFKAQKELYDESIKDVNKALEFVQYQRERRAKVLRERPKNVKEFIIERLQNRQGKNTIFGNISMSQFKMHTYAVGKSGSGKSYLLKMLFYYLLNESKDDKRYSLILLEPHGDLAEECRRLHLLDNDRIVYIDLDPKFETGYTPAINPLEVNTNDELIIDRRCQELTKVITEITDEQKLSSQMKTILYPCLSTLIRAGGKDLKDLRNFMDDNNNADLVEMGKRSPIEGHRDFFTNTFHNTAYKATKSSLETKLSWLLNLPTVSKFFRGKSTVDIKAEMDKGNVLIFGLSSGIVGEEVANTIGRFIVSTVKSIAMERASDKGKAPRKNAFLFIDECQNFVSPSIKKILTETRKYGLHLVFANQMIGQFTPELKEAVLNNTAIKITGNTSKKTRTAIGGEIDQKADDLTNVPEYHFFIKTDKMPKAMLFKPKGFLANSKSKYYLTAEQEKKQKAYLLENYYKKIESKGSSHGSENSTEQRQEGRQEQTPRQNKPKPKFDI